MEDMTEIRRRIAEEPDFIFVPRYSYSLKAVMERYPDGMPSVAARAKAMAMNEDDFTATVEGAVAKLRDFF